MPTYDFRCPKCSHHFEVFLPFGSKVRPPCPQCRHAKTEKLISSPAIHFKGTGFFKTDSRKPNKEKELKKPLQDTPKPTTPSKPEQPAPRNMHYEQPEK